jgi:nucleoid-associated protein YgaU
MSSGGRTSLHGTGGNASAASASAASASAASASAASAATREHVVRKNENLARISKRYYGTYNKWRRIYDANRGKITDPDVLKVGMRLKIPR